MADDKVKVYELPIEEPTEDLSRYTSIPSTTGLEEYFKKRDEAIGTSPEGGYKKVSVSDDPDAPKFSFPADVTDEQILEYLKSAEAEEALAQKGYVFKYGLKAARFDDPEDLDDTAFTKGVKGGWAGLKQIGAGALGTIADIVGAENLEKKMNKAIQQYQLDGMAEQFIKTESGEIIPFEASVEKILTEPDRLNHFLDWAAFNVGQGLVTSLPIFAASLLPGGLAIGTGIAYGMGVGDSRIAQLEATNFEEANAALSLALGLPYAAIERAFGAGLVIKKALLEKYGENAVKTSLGQIIKSTAKTNLGEAAAEGTQEFITSTGGGIEKGLQPGESVSAELGDLYSDKNFWKGVGEAAASGFIGGTPFGTVGGVVQARQIKEVADLAKNSRTSFIPTEESSVPPSKVDVNLARKDLKQRGFTEEFLKNRTPEEVVRFEKEKRNYVSKKQLEDLANLGYLNSEDGRNLIESFTENVALDKGAKKTKGTQAIESIIKNKQPYDGKVSKTKVQESEYVATPEEAQELWSYPEQLYTSAKTSRNQVPATHTNVNKFIDWEPGTVNADIGGGRFEKATEYLKDKGVTNLVYDPFNRTVEHNQEVVNKIINGGADTATVSNVLNVIKEDENIDKVLKQTHNALKDGGTAYFNFFEGDGRGQGKETKDGWQRNQKTADYLPIIQKYFPQATTLKGNSKVIIAPKTDAVAELASQMEDKTGPINDPNSIEKLKTELSKLGYRRDSRYGVGKRIGGFVYFHRMYARDVIGKNDTHFKYYQKLVKALALQNSNIELYDIIKYDPSTGNISLIMSLDFETRPEPLVYSVLNYKMGSIVPDKTIEYQKGKQPIYHHKWLFVKDSFDGFDVRDSMLRSLEWLEAIKSVEDPKKFSRIGSQEYWDTNVVPLLSKENIPQLRKVGFIDNEPMINFATDKYYSDNVIRNSNRLLINEAKASYNKDIKLVNVIDKPHPMFEYRFIIPASQREDGQPVRGSISGYKYQDLATKQILGRISMIEVDGYRVGESANVLKPSEVREIARGIARKIGVKNFDGSRHSGAKPQGTLATTPKALYSVVDGSGLGSVKFTDLFSSKRGKIYQRMREELNRLLLGDRVKLAMYDNAIPGKSPNVLGTFIYSVNTVTQALNLSRPQVIRLVSQPQVSVPPFLKGQVNDMVMFTLHHETIHAFFKNEFFNKLETQTLQYYADKEWIDYFNIKTRYPNLTLDQQREEAISDAFALFMAKRYAPKGIIRQAFEKLKNYLMALSGALNKEGFTDPEQIFNAVDLGKIQQRKIKQEALVTKRTITANLNLAKEKGYPVQGGNIIDPAYRYQNEYLEDGSDLSINQPVKGNRKYLKKSIREVKNLIQEGERVSNEINKNGQLKDDNPRRMSWFYQIFGHAKSWAEKYPMFDAMFRPIVARLNKARTLQTQFVNKLSGTFLSVIRNPKLRDALNDAFEASQLNPGRYRKNEKGQIIIPIVQAGKSKNSRLRDKVGQSLVLEGEIADAYEQAIDAIHGQSLEILRGMLGNSNTRQTINDIFKYLELNRPDLLKDNTALIEILKMPQSEFENLTAEELQVLVDALTETLKIKQNDPKAVDTITALLGSINEDGNYSGGIGEILQEVNRYNEFIKTDYVPLTRFGKKFIVVKDSTGKVVDYRMFGEGVNLNIFRNEEREIRTQLNELYPASEGYNISATENADYENLEKIMGTTILTIDAASSFLSESDVNAYVGIRKKIIQELGGKLNTSKGFSAFMKKRKEIGGIAGYETDFIRGISQFGMASSNYAASNRFDPETKSAYDRLMNESKDTRLKEAATTYLDYINNPEQEYAFLRQLGYWWYLGGNFSSAVIQLFSNIIFVGPMLGEFANSALAAAELSRAFKDVMKMVVFSNPKYTGTYVDYSKAPEDVKEQLLLDVYNSLLKPGMAFVEAGMSNSGSFSLTGQSDRKLEDIKRVAENTIIGGMFNTFETISRLVAYIATTRLMRNQKYRDKAASFFQGDANFEAMVAEEGGAITPRAIARQMVELNFGMYGKENRPQYMRGILSPVLLFNTYISQMFGLMWRLLTQQGTRNQKIMARRILAKIMLMIFLTGGMFALPGADDITWLINMFRKYYYGLDGDVRSELRLMVSKSLGANMTNLIENGLFNQLGIDISRRVGFQQITGSPQLRGALGIAGIDTGSKPAETFGAGGAVFLQNAANLTDALNRGTFSFADLVNSFAPTFIKNLYKGYQYGATGKAYTKYGTLITDDIGLTNSLAQSLGFRPSTVAKWSELQRIEKMNLGETSPIKSRFNNKIKKAFRDFIVAGQENDFEKQGQAQSDLMEVFKDILIHNSKYSGSPSRLLIYDESQINRLFKEAIYDLYFVARLESKTGERTISKTLKTIEHMKALGLQP